MLSPADFVESYAGIGEKKASAQLAKLLMLAILAGFAIAIGGAVTTIASYSIDSPSVAKLICGVLFPLGLFMVVMTGAELFTGNCLMTISMLERRIGLRGMLRNLTTVFIGNFIGALLVAVSIAVFSGPKMADMLVVKIVTTAAAKCSLSFAGAVVLGVLCNILVCLAVMSALCAKDVVGRAMGAFGPVCCFVICGFEHCIANMYYIPVGLLVRTVPECTQIIAEYGIDLSALTWRNFFLQNLLPVTIGNIIGGCGFAALIWAGHRKK